MLLLCALLLSGLQLGMSKFTYNLRCYECATINTFECSNLKTCEYEIRRCLTVSIPNIFSVRTEQREQGVASVWLHSKPITLWGRAEMLAAQRAHLRDQLLVESSVLWRTWIFFLSLNSREVLVYKNCTNNCTFVYESEMPPPAPKALRTNSFYWVRCCGLMNCNVGGPTNLERDILPDQIIEEELEGAVCLGGGGLWGALLSCASILLSGALT